MSILAGIFSPEVLKALGVAAELGEIAMMYRFSRKAAGDGQGQNQPISDERIVAALQAIKKHTEVKEDDFVDDIVFGGLVSALFADKPKIQAAAIKAKITQFVAWLETTHKMADRFRYNMFRLGQPQLGGPDVLKTALEDIADEPDDASRFTLVNARGWLKGAKDPIKFDAQRAIQLTQSLGQAFSSNVLPIITSSLGLIGDALRDGAFGAGGDADNPAADSAVGAVREFRGRLQDRKTELRSRLTAQQNPPAGGDTGNNQNKN